MSSNNINLTSSDSFSRKHGRRQQCLCGALVPIRQQSQHMNGKRHRKAVNTLQASAQDPTPARTLNPGGERDFENLAHCKTCDKNIPLFRWEFHLNHPEHLRTQRLADTRAALDGTADDKNGVKVSGETVGVDFGVVELDDSLGSPSVHSRIIEIWKTDESARVNLTNVQITSSVPDSTQISSFSATLGRSRSIHSGRKRLIIISFRPSYEGRYEETLELTFHDVRHSQRFSITRQIRATVGSKRDREHLKAKAPYVKRKFVPLPIEGPIIPPLRPPTWTGTKWVTSLREYIAPTALIKAAYGHHGRSVVARKFMPSFFNDRTYASHFQILVWIEEEQRSRDLLNFAMSDVLLEQKPPRYILKVAGLAEGRPSVIVGDYILVKRHDSSDVWHKGCVYSVAADSVSLCFDSSFSTFKGKFFDVQFVLNRMPFRRMHQGLTLKVNSARFLFPEYEHVRISMEQLNAITPINRLIGQDHEQLMTVAAILNQPPGSVPFIIFGPPGTGKTVTVVEAIRQLLDRDPNISILACAPSNSAADIIAERLITLGPSQLFRLNALWREYRDLPESLRDFSCVNGNSVFAIPPLEHLERFRVIVTTCVSGGIPHGLGFRQGHFSHIFIDEAGQCTEPEAMIPIKTLADNWTNIVVAGDKMQLGPCVRSRDAMALGLSTSYLARLMAREVYDLRTGTGSTYIPIAGCPNARAVLSNISHITRIVKLIKSFRSHPSILEFSNNHFYNGELQACGDPALTHSLLRSDLVRNNFPVIFHSIIGRDERESSSPSFFNIDEAIRVKKYCLELMGDRRLRLKPQDIGVITPYHAQRCKIGSILIEKLRGIKVGSVEEFQGQERRIIIISTVRSSTEYLNYDIKHTLGFVANSRRLNVAITRAQALLIIVGNPMVLSLDSLWRELLNYIHTHGGWRGKKIEWDPAEPILRDGYDKQMRENAEREASDTISRLKSLIVKHTEDLNLADNISESDSDGERYLDNGIRREEE